MKKLLSLALCFCLVLPSIAEAKGGGGGGGGRSGGGFSSGGGRSFSSGGSFSSSGGRSFSGGASSSSGSKTSTFTSSGSGRSYSGGNSSSTGTSGVSGRTYSAGKTSSTTVAGGNNSSGVASQPRASSYDSVAVKAQKTADSKAAYKASFSKGEAPKAEYKTASGKTAPIDPKDAKIDSLRGQLDHEKWVNRDLREENFYRRYSAPAYGSFWAPGVYYHDPYNSLFFLWLWDQSIETRALWMYNHQASMDQARYNALLAKDAQLDARLKQLEAQKVARDPTYAPKDVEPDLMYSNEYVDAVYNPTDTETASVSWGWLCCLLLLGGVVLFFVLLITNGEFPDFSD